MRILPRAATGVKYKSYNLHNFRNLPQIQRLSEDQIFSMEVVGHVFPFKINNYVVDELIDWDSVPDHSLFHLTFPQKGMLKDSHFEKMAAVLKDGSTKEKVKETANEIRGELNPHPAGQAEHNIPTLDGMNLDGMQHKYKETVLFFPSQGQTCHAYCSFCFRWPQFVGMADLKFATREIETLIAYLRQHPEISDILFTGGDPLIMKTDILASYIRPLLEADLPNLQSIRIGTKALAYWPYRFLTDSDSNQLLDLFSEVNRKGKHLAFMAHFSHPRELETSAVEEAIHKIRKTGTQIRTQSPILAHINDAPGVWQQMWQKQVKLGCIPYYMFVVRDTGAQHYFGIPLVRAWEIFQNAYKNVSGLSRTVRGPSMSATPGKVHILGVNEIHGEKVLVMQFLQARNPDWVRRPFFARYDEQAIWLDELKPAFGEEKFFFEDDDSLGREPHQLMRHRICETK
ncbi:MAG: lysine 2,3-aminomutase [bacterium]